MIKNKKILILGLAKSGLAVAKLLYKDNDVLVTDSKSNDEERINELIKLNIPFKESKTGEELLDNSYDLLIKNPGIEPFQKCVLKAHSLNIPVLNEMEIAYGYLDKEIPIIGITGSNGKTTTTTMTYDLLTRFGFKTVLAGNIGLPLSDVVKDIKNNDILLLEISDHQLYDLNNFKTNVSAFLNVCPTHLDYYCGSYEDYKNCKKKIFNHHTAKDLAIINYQNEDCRYLTKDILSKKEYFNNEENYYNETGIYIHNELIISLDDIKLKGHHNYENILASLLIVNHFTDILLGKEIIKEYLQNFNGVEHRLEIVPNKKNIAIFNDSKSTNPTATITALNTMDKPVRLILGGKERLQDFNEINKEMHKVVAIYAIGETTDRIYKYALENNFLCYQCYTLEKAMAKIKEDVKPKEAILLSPASASWDQYDKFETRGEEFKNLVEKLFN